MENNQIIIIRRVDNTLVETPRSSIFLEYFPDNPLYVDVLGNKYKLEWSSDIRATGTLIE